MLNLPNILTLSRIFVIPVVILLFYLDTNWARWINGGLFVAAAITDFFDGWLARRYNLVSPLGRFLDPIADKLLVAAVLMMLVAFNHIGAWVWPAAIVILMREILVSGLREFLAEIQVRMPVTKLAKWKTTVQLAALSVLIIGPIPFLPFLPVKGIGEILLWIAAIMTMITGWDYMKTGLAHMLPNPDGEPKS
ncbi:CDP-diacylglycerol--glycerol-3-phosphate 3-phosphatidyltransferase [Phaeovibrio sulfidiphilus]|uniref:CDP-diacylglycerol--glycerol-3-phosphate 3-phosphatidyltransferase n=1 Tax=Phaeovibrio sulfidiphilus TaxID=1220600 RepID=UPI0030846317